MARALTFASTSLSPLNTLAREALWSLPVLGCALALILAGH
jgi:hypothetical protein